MSFASGTSDPALAQPKPEPSRRRGLQFIVSAAGAAGLFWLANHIFIDEKHLPPDFDGRLRTIALSLTAQLVAICCLFWATMLYSAWSRKVEAQKVLESGEETQPRPRISNRVRKPFIAVYFLLGSVMLSLRYINLLWPEHARSIGLTTAISFALLVASGFLLQHHGMQTHIPRGQDDFGRPREPITVSTPVLIAMALVFLVAAIFAAHMLAKRFVPAHEMAFMRAVIVLSSGAFGFLIHTVSMRKSTHSVVESQMAPAYRPQAVEDEETRRARRRKKRNTAALFIFEICIALILASHVPPSIKNAVFFGQFGVIFVWLIALAYLKQWTYRLSRSGQFDRALRLNRLWLMIPGYGNSIEGLILFNAGRYGEARVFMKPLAFNAQGKPRLASTDLYVYSLALINDGHPEEAQPLLEQAVQVSPKRDGIQVALASCLLTQEKDADRACKLLEQAMAAPRKAGSGYGGRSDGAARVARYAWALASTGRRNDAERKIEEALTQARQLKSFDQAGVNYFIGEAWRMLRETQKARAAFEQAMALSPTGVVALSARKGLAKLNDKWPAWSS